jgi:site-specific DNA recombinase
MRKHPSKQVDTKTHRCAIYTRKSTEEGLQQEFNTLDAQREAGEAYIAAQKHEGWICLPDRYDDGGFTGGNMERPALKRLMTDISAGKVDCVVVYKVDRLSRSLMDFSRIMETFDKHRVSFVSVTQQFNTTHSMGRLTLNILLSFAQFEREIISERTRDKIAAARRKGKFAGGKPVLGYDILSSPTGTKLLVNPDEAEQVKAIFALYLKHQGLVATVTELNRRHWTTKRFITKAGKSVGGRKWVKTDLFKVLTNVLYVGKIKHHDQTHQGEHDPIIAQRTWQKVQATLTRNSRTGGSIQRNKHGALLRGLLRCSCCDCSMGHAYTRKGERLYRYYVCLNAQKQGWHSCPSKSIPAGEIETFVVEQIKGIGADPALLARTIQQLQQQHEQTLAELQKEEKAIGRQLSGYHAEITKLAGQSGIADRLTDVNSGIASAEQRLAEVRGEIEQLSKQTMNTPAIEQTLLEFTPLWESLSPKEQARVLYLLVERVDYDGGGGDISITFRPNGLESLTQQFAEVAA